MTPTLYGIKNCDTVRKARRWLAEHGIEYRFHDFRTNGLDPDLLRTWVAEIGWEALLNRRGITWRSLPEETRDGLDESGATELMLGEPTLIRRPVLDLGSRRLVGFEPGCYAQELA